MSFARGKYGVEYTRRKVDEKSHGLRWIMVILGAFLVVSYILTRIFSGREPARIEDAERGDEKTVIEQILAETPPPAGKASKTASPPPTRGATASPRRRAEPKRIAAQTPERQISTTTAEWLKSSRERPATERVLLERLAAAERKGDLVVAIDTVKRLCDRPAVADIHPLLWKRLGRLNRQLFFSERSSPWTARVTIKRGDSRDRLAREYRTTGSALERLNPMTNWGRIRPGDVVRVLQYPKAVLVVHKKLGFADLSLKGDFFCRYLFDGAVKADSGVYPIANEVGKTAHARLRMLGVVFSQADRADLEMFLAAESSVNVSDQ